MKKARKRAKKLAVHINIKEEKKILSSPQICVPSTTIVATKNTNQLWRWDTLEDIKF